MCYEMYKEMLIEKHLFKVTEVQYWSNRMWGMVFLVNIPDIPEKEWKQIFKNRKVDVLQPAYHE
jgi:hypothetical protein